MFSKINRNIYKPPVAEATKEIVRKNFTREIEFFEFCKQGPILRCSISAENFLDKFFILKSSTQKQHMHNII
jgi:hypothetical protein